MYAFPRNSICEFKCQTFPHKKVSPQSWNGNRETTHRNNIKRWLRDADSHLTAATVEEEGWIAEHRKDIYDKVEKEQRKTQNKVK